MYHRICIALTPWLLEGLMASSNYGLFASQWLVGEQQEKLYLVPNHQCSTPLFLVRVLLTRWLKAGRLEVAMPLASSRAIPAELFVLKLLGTAIVF